jgi:probable HAF family extracellular repeat protein
MVGLGYVSPADRETRASGVSANGASVVGSTDSTRAFRWSASGGMVNLGASTDQARAASADGSVIVGRLSTGGSIGTAFRWTQSTGVVSLGTLPTLSTYYPYSDARGVSSNGQVIVGSSSFGAGNMQAIRWTQVEGMVGLGDLPGASVHSSATAVSADGLVIVGWGTSTSGTEAFRWTAASGMTGLGDLPGGTFSSTATACSADGSVVVGTSQTENGAEAFIWDAQNGMRNLRSVLMNGAPALAGWMLTSANGISADGCTIVGVGVNPEGRTEAWRAKIRANVIRSGPLSEPK